MYFFLYKSFCDSALCGHVMSCQEMDPKVMQDIANLPVNFGLPRNFHSRGTGSRHETDGMMECNVPPNKLQTDLLLVFLVQLHQFN